MNTKSIDFCAAALRRWIEEGANMPKKAELPKLVECVEELLFAYNTLRQRAETLSEVLIDAAAHGMVLRQSNQEKPPENG